MLVTYYVGDILTGLILGDLPFKDVTFESQMCATGTFKGKLKLSDPDVIARGGSDLVLEGKSTLYVEVDGVLIWAGIIWATSYDSTNSELEVAGADFWSYLQRRIVTDDITMTGATTQSVIDTVLSYALTDNAPANLSVAYTGTDAATQTMDFVYKAADRKYVSEILEGLASATPSFDFRVDTYWAGDSIPWVTYTFGLPRLGRDLTTSGVSFDLPGGVVKYTETRDATTLTGRMFVRGNSDGTEIQEYTFEDSALYLRYPRYDQSESIDQSDPAVVQSRGRYMHFARKRIAKKPAVVVRPDEPHISTYSVGDTALLRIDDPRHPGGESFAYRIVTTSLDVANQEVTLTHWEDPNG